MSVMLMVRPVLLFTAPQRNPEQVSAEAAGAATTAAPDVTTTAAAVMAIALTQRDIIERIPSSFPSTCRPCVGQPSCQLPTGQQRERFLGRWDERPVLTCAFAAF
jgi:hypothetical protein